MPRPYHIQDLARGGLFITSRKDMPAWERLLIAGFVGTFAGVACASSMRGGWWWTVLSIVVAAMIYGIIRGDSGELQVTNVEFVTKVVIAQKLWTHRIVNTGDVLRIQFRKGGFFKPGWDGLYAVTANRTICILPLLDSQATEEVIRAIEGKFPGLAEGWTSRQHFQEVKRVGGNSATN